MKCSILRGGRLTIEAIGLIKIFWCDPSGKRCRLKCPKGHGVRPISVVAGMVVRPTRRLGACGFCSLPDGRHCWAVFWHAAGLSP